MDENNFIRSLKWRSATKEFDPEKKVPEEEFNEIIEAARLAASSFGLQPFKMVVVKDKKLRQKLFESAGQNQIKDASHFVVFSARTDINEELVMDYLKLIAKTREIPIESLDMLKGMLMNFIEMHSDKTKIEWAKRQCYISLGTMLSACALKRIDACPMEGFSPEEFDEILNLKKENLASAVLCAIGYRSNNDHSQNYKKVRKSKKNLILEKL